MSSIPPEHEGSRPIHTESAEPADVVPYDWSSRDRVVRGLFPALEMIHDRFLRMFRLTLSSALRMVVDISVRSTEFIKFGDYLQSLPVPTSLNLFRMSPLRGNSIMALETRLVFTLIDLFFGGTGKLEIKAEGRDFSAIEQAMIKGVVISALEDLQTAWRPLFPVQITYTRTEVNPQFVAIVPQSEVVLVVTFDVEMGLEPMAIRLCIPYSMLEPLGSLLRSGIASDRFSKDPLWSNRIRSGLHDAKLEVAARLEGHELSIGDFLDLDKGDLLPARASGCPLAVLLNGTRKFGAVLTSVRGHRAVRIEKVMSDRPSEVDQLRAEAEALAAQARKESHEQTQPAPGETGLGASSGDLGERDGPLSSIKGLAPGEIAELISHEHPQTISLILAHLGDAKRTAAVLQALPESLRADVIYRIATLESVQRGVLQEINTVLAREVEAFGAYAASRAGGVGAVSRVLAELGESTAARALASIETRDPEAARNIREDMKTSDRRSNE